MIDTDFYQLTGSQTDFGIDSFVFRPGEYIGTCHESAQLIQMDFLQPFSFEGVGQRDFF